MRCFQGIQIRIKTLLVTQVMVALSVLSGAALMAQREIPDPKRTHLHALEFRTISGKVTDRAGAPVAGALVAIENERIGTIQKAADSNGRWGFRNLLFKNEELGLTISAQGFLTRKGKITCTAKNIPIAECGLIADPRFILQNLLEEAENLRQSGKIMEARHKLDEIAKMDMGGSLFNIALASKYVLLGDLDSALEVAERGLNLARYSQDPVQIRQALENLGDIKLHRFEFRKALPFFMEALEQEPPNKDQLLVKIADVHLLLNQKESAVEGYRKAMRLNPELEKQLQGEVAGITSGWTENKVVERDRNEKKAGEQAEAELAVMPDRNETLVSVLKKSAEYAEKLETAAFRYVCIEDVIESTWPNMPYAGKNQYRYDFQIIGNNKTIVEQRKLLSLNGLKMNKRNAKQKTVFQSHLKTFAVVDLLGRENQGKYNYRILRNESLNGKAYLLIDIRKKAPQKGDFQLEGTALVYPHDGSVIRIEFNQSSIIGHEGRRRASLDLGFEDAVIKDVHWFEVQKGGLNFPSRSFLTERLKLGDVLMPHYAVEYRYSKYAFFSVSIKDVRYR
ncbi:MAG TPA: hypothetical protein ENN40_05480 [Candidatus Aminicenantes bacterium]|nr:hypothetical protein [Candidatus Aminicenantes bacterium]